MSPVVGSSKPVSSIQIIAEFFNEIESASFGSYGLVAALTEHWVAARSNAS
jgi:hypothetical protein